MILQSKACSACWLLSTAMRIVLPPPSSPLPSAAAAAAGWISVAIFSPLAPLRSSTQLNWRSCYLPIPAHARVLSLQPSVKHTFIRATLMTYSLGRPACIPSWKSLSINSWSYAVWCVTWSTFTSLTDITWLVICCRVIGNVSQRPLQAAYRPGQRPVAARVQTYRL